MSPAGREKRKFPETRKEQRISLPPARNTTFRSRARKIRGKQEKLQARKAKEKASCGEDTAQEESGGRGKARQTAMEGEPEGHGRVGWLQAGPTLRTHPREAMLKMAALLPLPLPPLLPSLSLHVCRACGCRWPTLTRQKRLEWQSSRLAPFGTKQELILTATTHTPLSHSLRQERKRQTERERERERQTPGGKGGGGTMHTQIIIQLNKGFTYRQARTRNSGRINNPGGEWYRRRG